MSPLFIRFLAIMHQMVFNVAPSRSRRYGLRMQIITSMCWFRLGVVSIVLLYSNFKKNFFEAKFFGCLTSNVFSDERTRIFQIICVILKRNYAHDVPIS